MEDRAQRLERRVVVDPILQRAHRLGDVAVARARGRPLQVQLATQLLRPPDIGVADRSRRRRSRHGQHGEQDERHARDRHLPARITRRRGSQCEPTYAA
jgi:hypothetical protein